MGNYATPGAPADPVNWQELTGSLLLVKPLSVETGIQTVHGAASAVRANMTVLDGPQRGREYADALVFPRMLQAQLKSRIGKMVLGRLTQGQAKPGQTAPWVLDAATDADKQIADQYRARNSQPTYAAPASAQAPF